MKFIVAYILFPVISYLLGSVSFGLIVAKIKGVDLRGQGSGNIGTTNVVRVLGTKLGIVVFCLDMLKGAVPALLFAMIAQAISGAPSWKMLGIVYGACAIFGHVYPLFHELSGGKAVATSCGVFLCLAPLQTFTAVAIWAVVLLFWKYVSVASMAAAGSFFLMVISPLYRTQLFSGDGFYYSMMNSLYPIPPGLGGREKLLMSLLAFVAVAVVFYRHRANIKRLKEGTEPKILASREDRRAKEAEKKYGKERLRRAGGRRIRTRRTETLRQLSRQKEEGDTEELEEEKETAEQDEEIADSQQLETAALLEDVEEISAEDVEPMVEEKNTDTQETRDLQELEEAPEDKDEAGNTESNHGEHGEH